MKNTVLRFTLMRLMIFFGCLLVYWLVGLRSEAQQPWLLLAAAVTSVILSYFLLRRERDRMSERFAEKVDRRLQARREGIGGEDEDAEDAELEGR